jgi:hypothetical protein
MYYLATGGALAKAKGFAESAGACRHPGEVAATLSACRRPIV